MQVNTYSFLIIKHNINSDTDPGILAGFAELIRNDCKKPSAARPYGVC